MYSNTSAIRLRWRSSSRFVSLSVVVCTLMGCFDSAPPRTQYQWRAAAPGTATNARTPAVRYNAALTSSLHPGPRMRAIVKVDPIEIDKVLFDFVAREALPGTGVDEQSFWKGFAGLVGRLAPRNAALL